MKRIKPLAGLAWVACLASISLLAAEEVATVTEDRVNVRGQPSLVGEVITQLQKGDRVVILEEITSSKAKTNEPPKWARIQMPANTPVWVFAPFLDANKAVKVSRLNLRAGPGENYSVVGRLERGTPVKEIRRVEDWLEVEPPPGAYAFVAADLLRPGEPSAAPALAATPPPAAAPEPAADETLKAPAATPPAVTPSLPVPPAVDQAAAPAVVQPQATPPALPSVAQTPVQTPPPTPAPIPAPGTSPETSAVAASPASQAETPPRRIVRREGLVRSTTSIQAPTYYELLNPDNRKTINYLHTDKLDLNLKDYRGRRIIVTGEEAIDPRWPRTPVIEVEKLELIP